ncbi:MAG: hypothetical protein JXO48_12990, partial [Deltaproteobacteria bacterium]|nr:hypothetical protein [Deltaproteobacteria bacterium]
EAEDKRSQLFEPEASFEIARSKPQRCIKNVSGPAKKGFVTEKYMKKLDSGMAPGIFLITLENDPVFFQFPFKGGP